MAAEVHEEDLGPCLTGDHLAAVGRDLSAIPAEYGDQFGEVCTSLDLSDNEISSLEHLEKFTKLKQLVLDRNNLQTWPAEASLLPSLQTLWINSNQIENLEEFLENLAGASHGKVCKLTYLSMLKNPACPNALNGKDADDYRRYRLFVIYRIKSLKFLDAAAVTEEERVEAERVGGHIARVARPDPGQYQKASEDALPDGQVGLDSLETSVSQQRCRFGVSTYVYYGKNSEGNRFIMNDDL